MDCNPPGFSVHGISQARILYHYATRKAPYVSLSSLNFVHLFFTDFLFLVWFIGKESMCQCRRLGFNPWVGKNPWRREWQPTPVFLAGKFHGQRSLAGYRSRGPKSQDTTYQLPSLHLLQYCFCFVFWLFGHETCGILAPWTGIEPELPAVEAEILATRPPGKSLCAYFWLLSAVCFSVIKVHLRLKE